MDEIESIDWAPEYLEVNFLPEIFFAQTVLGDGDSLIPKYGVYLLGIHEDNYYRVAFVFEREMQSMIGKLGIHASSNLFIEAGHVCAFNTLVEFICTLEWESLVEPGLKLTQNWIN